MKIGHFPPWIPVYKSNAKGRAMDLPGVKYEDLKYMCTSLVPASCMTDMASNFTK